MATYRLRLVDSLFQTFNTTINNISYRITIKFFTTVKHWTLDVYNVTEARQICQGQALSLGTPLLWESAEDLVFFITDISSLAIDPGTSVDMANRIILWAADNDDDIIRTFLPT